MNGGKNDIIVHTVHKKFIKLNAHPYFYFCNAFMKIKYKLIYVISSPRWIHFNKLITIVI